jgi:hypothetical protein
VNLGENEAIEQRLRNLEAAVRDLQDQVYDLRMPRQGRVVTSVVCSLKTAFDGTFVGKASTKIEAEAIARNKCEAARASFCNSTKFNCETVQEEVF